VPPIPRIVLPARYPDPAALFARVRAGEAVIVVVAPHDWHAAPGRQPAVGERVRLADAAGTLSPPVRIEAVTMPRYGDVDDALARAAGQADADAFRAAFYPLLARQVDVTDARPLVAVGVRAASPSAG